MQSEKKNYIGKLTSDAVMSCSRLPAIMGYSQFSTPNDELTKSCTAASLGDQYKRDDSLNDKDAIIMGNLYEGPILLDGARRLGLQIDAEITERVEHASLPLQGSLDGILHGDGRIVTTDEEKGIYVYNAESVCLDGPGVAEAKLTSAFASETPAAYRGPIQCQGLQMCTGHKWHAIFTLYRGIDFRIYIGAEDAALQAKIADDVNDFQRRVDLFQREGVMDYYAAMTPNDASKTYQQPEDDLPAITLTGSVNETAHMLLKAKAQKANLERYISDLQTKIMDHMGLHSTAFVTDGEERVAQITWPMTPARKEYTVKARGTGRAKSLRIKELNND